MLSLLIMIATICVHHLHSKQITKGTTIHLRSMGHSLPVIFDSISRSSDKSQCFARVKVHGPKANPYGNVLCSELCLIKWTRGFVGKMWCADNLIPTKVEKVKVKPPAVFMLYYNASEGVLASWKTNVRDDNRGQNEFMNIPFIVYGRYKKFKGTWVMEQKKNPDPSNPFVQRHYERAKFEAEEVEDGVYLIKNHLEWKATGITGFIGSKSSKLEKGKLFLKYGAGVEFTTEDVTKCGDACKWKLVRSQFSVNIRSKKHTFDGLRWQNKRPHLLDIIGAHAFV
eukprot:21619_1